MVIFLMNLSVAVLMGFLAGMGIGGGSLLLLWLTQVAGFEQQQARIINLLFFLPAAAVSTFFRRKNNQLDKSTTVTATISGCIAAIAFSLIGKMIDVALLKKLFGGLLIVAGIREIFYRPRKAR